MGQIGFSYTGLLFLLLLFLPNLFWAGRKPVGYDPKGENRVLLFLERTGEVCVTASALLFSDFNPRGWTLWSLWLAAAGALMACYECWWIRYFRSERTLQDFYSSFLGIPLAGTTLPVAAFFCLGVYGKVIWALLADAVLAAGHIGIHLQHARALCRTQENSKEERI